MPSAVRAAKWAGKRVLIYIAAVPVAVLLLLVVLGAYALLRHFNLI